MPDDIPGELERRRQTAGLRRLCWLILCIVLIPFCTCVTVTFNNYHRHLDRQRRLKSISFLTEVQLINVLAATNTDEEMAAKAVEGLGRETSLNQASVERLIDYALDNRFGSVLSSQILEVVAKNHQAIVSPDRLVPLLQSKDQRRRLATLTVLLHVKGFDDVTKLAVKNALAEGIDKTSLARAIGRAGPDGGKMSWFLFALLEGGDPDIEGAAIGALLRVRADPPRVRERLRKIIADQERDDVSRSRAATSLEYLETMP